MTAWLDVMPAIPLARAVPVVGAMQFGHRKRGIMLDSERVIWTSTGTRPEPAGAYARVDLDDPQGFAYALRWLVSDGSHALGGYDYVDVALRLTQGLLGNSDRLALAKVAVEVARG